MNHGRAKMIFEQVKRGLFLVLLVLICLLIWHGSALAATPYAIDKGLEAITKQLLADKSVISGRSVAVTEFAPMSGEAGSLGAFLSEEIYTHLSNNGIKLLEKRLLEDALRELKLNMTDMVDPEHAKQFGRFTGTELLLVGSLTILHDTIRINTRLIEIESRVIVGAASAELYKNKELLKVMGIPYPGSILIVSTSSADVYLDGRLAGTTDWFGKLKVEKVKPGNYNIELRRDGYRYLTRSIVVSEDTEVRVEVDLEKLPSPAVATTLSLLFPGAGDLYLGHSDWWIYTVAVGSSIYGAYVYSKKTDEIIWKDGGQYGGGKWEKRGNGPVYLFAGLAAAIWIYDIYHVGASASDTLEKVHESGLSLKLDPGAKSVMLVKQWKW